MIPNLSEKDAEELAGIICRGSKRKGLDPNVALESIQKYPEIFLGTYLRWKVQKGYGLEEIEEFLSDLVSLSLRLGKDFGKVVDYTKRINDYNSVRDFINHIDEKTHENYDIEKIIRNYRG